MVSRGWRGILLIYSIVTLLRLEGWHRDAEAQGIKVMSFAVLLLLARHGLAGAERKW